MPAAAAGASPGPPSARPRASAALPERVDLDRRSMLMILVSFVALLAFTALVRAARDTATGIALGGLVALALNPVVDQLSAKTRFGRKGCVALVFIIFALLVVALAVLLVPPAVRQARALQQDLPRVVHHLGDLPLIGRQIRSSGFEDRVLKTLQGLPQRLRGDATPVQTAVRSLAAGLSSGLVILLVAVSLLVDGPRLIAAGRRLVPQRRLETADQIGRIAYRAVGRYVAGSLLMATVAGVSTLVVGLALRVPLTPLLAVSVAVFDLVPQVGGALGGIPFILLGLTRSGTTGLLCALFFVIYQQVKHNVLMPVLVGQAVQLSPPATLAVALIGVAAGGVVGALISIPLVGSIKLVYLELRPKPAEARRRRRRLPHRRRPAATA